MLAWVVTIGISLERKKRGTLGFSNGMAGICLALGLIAETSCGGVTGSGAESSSATGDGHGESENGNCVVCG